MTIGDRIKQRRLELGLSQDEVAKKVGYQSRSSINKLESSRNLPLTKVEMMAKALECSPGYLMGWVDDGSIIETAETDVALSNMEKRLKEYALKLSNLPKDKQEHIMDLIDMLSEGK